MTLSRIFLFCVIVALLGCITPAAVIRCFDCTTADNSKGQCRDVFRSEGVATVECSGYCYKEVLLNHPGQDIINRGCVYADIFAPTDSVKKGCAKLSRGGKEYRSCGCGSDYCNSADITSPTVSLISLALITFFFCL